MFQAVDPTRRGAPLDHGIGEGFRPQRSQLATADLWILEVLRAQAIPCSFFLLGFGLTLGLDAALRCWWCVVWPFQPQGSLSFLTRPPSFYKMRVLLDVWADSRGNVWEKQFTSIGSILSLQDMFDTGLLNCANTVGLSLISLAFSVFWLLHSWRPCVPQEMCGRTRQWLQWSHGVLGWCWDHLSQYFGCECSQWCMVAIKTALITYQYNEGKKIFLIGEVGEKNVSNDNGQDQL